MTQNRKIRLVLTNDPAIGRQIFNAFTKEETKNIEVLGAAANAQELSELIARQEPDVILLDLEIPGLDGFRTLKMLAEKHQGVRTIIVSSHYNEFYISELILCGACAYVAKTAFVAETFRTIHKVYADGYYFNKGVMSHVMQTLIEDKALQGIITAGELMEDEITILQKICDEKQKKEISAALSIRRNFNSENNSRDKKTDPSIIQLLRYMIRKGAVALTT